MSLLSRLFRSKAQKAVDALQENLNRRLLAVEGGLKLFKEATDAFDGSGDEASFRIAQGKHQYFTNALIDDLGHVEELLKAMKRDLDYNSGRPSPGFASEVIHAEKTLERTDKNVNRLVKITQELLDLAGESLPDDTQRGKDVASLKTLLNNAKARKSDLDDTMAHLDKILDGMIANYEETGTHSVPPACKEGRCFHEGRNSSLVGRRRVDRLPQGGHQSPVD